MEKFVKRFIIISIIYLGIASIIGICMLVVPERRNLIFMHSHLMLLGWVSMMIYGVGYHILPRFTGNKLKSVKMGEIQFVLANIGLVGMVICYTLQMIPQITGFFGALEVVSIILFLYNMIVTLTTVPPAD